MKLIDFDGLFDEKLAEYMRLNAGKYTEKQWENIIPKLYKQFGDTFIPRAKNTPKGYFAAMTDDELVEALQTYCTEGVPVPDFLCNELEGRKCPQALIGLIRSKDAEIATLAVNLAGDDPRAFDAYFDLLEEGGDEDVAEAACEQLKSGADLAKERALDLYARGVRPELMLEILSRCKEREERVFAILLRAFRESGEELPMRASYLAAYGDPRALPYLLETIDRDDINFLEFQELRYAIEALGGEYTRPRDFSDDPYYREILAEQQGAEELMRKKTDA